MAERFLTLMADLDDVSQKRLSEWNDALKKAGFVGTQTPGLPYHISMAAFPLEREGEIDGLMKEVAGKFPPIAVHFSHIGIFAGGKVLFARPKEARGWMRFTTRAKRRGMRAARGRRMSRP